MPTSRPLSIVVVVLISMAGEVKAVTAQISPAPAKVSPAGVKVGPTADIAFYLARGDADSCGRGCKEWIAAEGKIDLGAAQRLRRLLAKLGRRRPPIFFHSMGGSIIGSIELGRLIRDQKLEVSVAHTIPGGCDRDKPLDESCEALKRSGQELEAQFDPAISMCNSGCVWAFVGGTTRFIPPWVKLGIHDVGLDPDKALPRRTSVSDVERAAHARIVEYVREMGIDKALPAAAFAVPFESPRFLERDEIARYGIDRRDFGETGWYFADKPTAAMSKRFFVRTDSGGQPRYHNGLVHLDCGVRQEIRLAFGQQHDSSERNSADPVIDVNGQRIVLPYQIPSREFDLRSAYLSAETVDLIGHGASIKVSGIGQGRNNEPAGSITLNMDGFLDGSAKLRKGCDQSARNAAAVRRGTKPAVLLPTAPNSLTERAQSLLVQPLPPPAGGFGPPPTPGTGPAVLSPTAPNSLTDPKSVPTVTIRSDQAEQKRIEDDRKRAQSLPAQPPPLPAAGFGPPPNTFTRGPVR
jgi:hypothetical protein